MFKMINKHCLNLIQKGCVMVVAIRTKTQLIMLEATIWSQVIQPWDVTCSIPYSSGSFRFRPVSRTGNFLICDIGMSC